MNAPERRSVLHDVALLEQASPAELSALAAALREVHVEPGGHLLDEGDWGSWFALIAHGDAHVRRHPTASESGSDRRIATLGPGAVVGEIALLTGARRSATVTAGDTTLVAYVGDADAFAHLLTIEGVAPRLRRTAAQRLAARAPSLPVHDADGGALGLRIRPGLATDREKLTETVARLSDESRRRRFFRNGPLPDHVISYLMDFDHLNHFAWMLTDDAGAHIIGGARYDRTDDPESAEVAFVLLDEWQGHGLGTLVFSALAIAAPVAGITRFTAEVLRENLPGRKLLSIGDPTWKRADGQTLIAEMAVSDLPPVHDPALAAGLAEIAEQVIGSARRTLR